LKKRREEICGRVTRYALRSGGETQDTAGRQRSSDDA